MAVTAREVILVFRGQNYLSGAIRRVGRDVGTLSRNQQLNAQRRQLEITRQRLNYTRMNANAELRSLQTGARRLALEQSLTREMRLRPNAILTNLRALSEMDRLQRQGKTLPRMNAAQMEAEQRRVTSLLATQLGTISQESVRVQQLVARYAALEERQSLLTQRINTTGRSLDLVNSKLKQNALQMRMLPIERWQGYARGVEHAGRLIQMFGLIAGASFGYAADQAAKFNTQATLAATQMITLGRNSVMQIHRTSEAVGRDVLKFLSSGQAVVSSAEAQTAAYAIPSGIPSLRGNSLAKARQTIALIKEFNQVVKANYGLVDLNGVTEAGIILINTFGTSMTRLPHEFDVMQKAVNRGKITMAEFVAGLGQTAPAARSAGYSFDAMAGPLSFLSGKLPQYTRVTAGYARALELFQNNKFQTFMKQNGAAVTNANHHLLSFAKIIGQILKVDPKLATGGNLIDFLVRATGTRSTIQARRVLTPALQDLQGLQQATQSIPEHTAGLVNAQATALSKTGAVKWKELTTQIKALVIAIGQGAIPAFVALSKPLQAAVNWFNRLSPSTRHLIGEIGAFAALGALLGGTFLAIAGGAASLSLSIIRLYTVWKEARIGLALLSTEAGLISVRFALGLGALAAIPLLIKYHTQIARIIHDLGGFQAVLIALTAGMAALRLAPIILAMAGIATEANTAAAATGSLRLALLALGGPEVLAALAAVTAALIIIYALHNKTEHVRPKGFVTSRNGEALIKRNGQFFTSTRDDVRDRVPNLITPISVADASDKFKVNLTAHSAIAQAVADSPRYQHAIRANQAAVDAFAKSLDKLNQQRFAFQVVRATRQIQRDPSLLQQIRNVQSLNALAVRAPNQQAGLAAWTRYENALTTLLAGKTAAQKAAIRSVLKTAVLPAAVRDRTPQQWISIVENARKRMLANPRDLQAAQNYENKINQLNTAFKNQPALLAAINDVLGSYDTNLKKATNSAKALGVTFQDVMSKIQSMYQGFQQQEQSIFGTLFQGPFVNNPLTQNRLQWGGRLTGRDLLRDLRLQIGQFRQFHGVINNLQRRGASNQLIDELMQQGPSALPQIRALNRLSPSDLHAYFSSYNQAQKMIHQQTMRDLNRQLRIYRQHGRNIALAIIAGLRDENVNLTQSLTRMIRRMFPGLPTGATGPGGRPTHTRVPQAGTTVVHNTTVHNHGRREGVSEKNAARHASLKARARYTGRGPVPR